MSQFLPLPGRPFSERPVVSAVRGSEMSFLKYYEYFSWIYVEGIPLFWIWQKSKKDLLLLLLPFPLSFFIFFFLSSQQERSFCVRKKDISQLIWCCLDHQNGETNTALSPNSKIFPSHGFASQATLTKILVTVPASNQGAGAWNIHLYSEEFFVRFQLFGTLERNYSTPFGAVRLFLVLFLFSPFLVSLQYI